jgi:hypothetical protein
MVLIGLAFDSLLVALHTSPLRPRRRLNALSASLSGWYIGAAGRVRLFETLDFISDFECIDTCMFTFDSAVPAEGDV